MKGGTLSVGRRGELLGAQYLRNLGYKIIALNWRHKNHHEIDIVALSPNKETLIGVEVRSHNSSRDVEPFESIDDRKIKRIAHAIQLFRNKEKYSDSMHLQVDVLSIIIETHKIEHFEAVNLKP